VQTLDLEVGSEGKSLKTQVEGLMVILIPTMLILNLTFVLNGLIDTTPLPPFS
jgi:hypothetical protein